MNPWTIAPSLQHRKLTSRQRVEGVVDRHTSNTGSVNVVLNNHRKHHVPANPNEPDPLSSGKYFGGWSDYQATHDRSAADSPVSPPGWKLSIGWREWMPLIPVGSRPG